MIELWLLRSWNCQNRESQRACYCKVTMWFRYVSFINISRYSTLFVPTSSYWLSSPPRPGPVKDLAELTDKVWSKSNGLPQAEEARGNLLVERNSCSWITVFHTELGLDCVHQRYYFHSCSLGWGKRSIQFLHWSWKVLRGGGYGIDSVNCSLLHGEHAVVSSGMSEFRAPRNSPYWYPSSLIYISISRCIMLTMSCTLHIRSFQSPVFKLAPDGLVLE